MNKKITTLIVAVIVIAGFAIGTYTYQTNNDHKKTAEPTTNKKVDAKPKHTANTVEYNGKDGKTALELLQTAAKADISGTGANAYVTSINDVVANTSSEYWAFYINGKLSSVGAGSYTTANTDVIKWELSKF